MLEFIQQMVFEITGKKNITLDTDFVKDLELNSFDIVNLICAFENHFQTAIPTRDVWKLHQVKDVVAYLEKRGITQP